MIALLSGAWWAQKLTGIAAQAIAVATAVALIVAGICALRHDARMDERTTWENRMVAARLQAFAAARVRDQKAQAIATQNAAVWQAQVAASEAAKQEAEAKLEAMRARVIAYPKDIVEALNR